MHKCFKVVAAFFIAVSGAIYGTAPVSAAEIVTSDSLFTLVADKLSPAIIAQIINDEAESTFPPEAIEFIVNATLADWIADQCPSLRVNKAAENLAFNPINNKYSHHLSQREIDRWERMLPEGGLVGLMSQYYYELGGRGDGKSDCYVGRKQIKAKTVLGSFLLD